MSPPLIGMSVDFQPVLLWTDALLFVLIGLGLLAVMHVRAQPPLREAWRKVGKRPTGMAAATVLLAFLAVGVLDSLHYRPLLPAVAAGATIIVADPRFSIAASKARHYLPVKPGTDLALLLAWMPFWHGPTDGQRRFAAAKTEVAHHFFLTN